MNGRRIALGLAAILALGGLWWALSGTGALEFLTDGGALRRWLDGLGPIGPIALVGLMTAAIVFSPIPSGPVAVAAGAAYGPLWGGLLVVAGSQAGALIAFALARRFGRAAVERWTGGAGAGMLAWLEGRSQAWLMGLVFASRLVPFLSFDAVSYAAGLTPLTAPRFALATLAGVVPISFLLTYAGEEMVSGDARLVGVALAVLGAVTLAPLAVRLLRARAPAGGADEAG